VLIISWPCILKLDGDDELIYLGSEKELKTECSELIFSDDDYVIDSAGFSYFISKTVDLIKTDKVFEVNELIDLVRANEFKKAELCLTKIHFVTVSDAINSLVY
jgi:hypothetical protein